MNKRNFGRVIKRIEDDPSSWNQDRLPECGTPYCFLGHAHFLRVRSNLDAELSGPEDTNLGKWLGLSRDEMFTVWHCKTSMDDLKRWHKAGKVS